MLRQSSQRPLLAYFDAIKALRLRQLSLVLKAGYDPNLMLNGRGQNGLQFMVQYFAASEAHMMRLEIPAARAAYLNIAKLLLDAGLDPNATDLITGESVIYDAIKLHDRDLVNLLLHYVDLSLRNKDAETALMCAARFGNKQIMRLMLIHLHELELDEFYLVQRNRFGLTALDLARAENLECAKLLAKHLITLGHPSNALLTRSSSHHQLNLARQALLRRPLATPAAVSGGASSRSAHHRAIAASHYAALNDPLVMSSDCESLIDGYGFASSGPRASQHHLMSRRSHGYNDPRVAEFNRFLMTGRKESSGAMGHGSSSNGLAAPWKTVGASTSDEEDEEAANSDLGPFGSSGQQQQQQSAYGAMFRSRSSCNLGPGSHSGNPEKKLSDGGVAGANSSGLGPAGKYGQQGNASMGSSKKTK